jgi:hypothetical protein
MKTFKSRIEYYVFCLRLAKRVGYLYFTVNNKAYACMTLGHLFKLISGSLSTADHKIVHKD